MHLLSICEAFYKIGNIFWFEGWGWFKFRNYKKGWPVHHFPASSCYQAVIDYLQEVIVKHDHLKVKTTTSHNKPIKSANVPKFSKNVNKFTLDLSHTFRAVMFHFTLACWTSDTSFDPLSQIEASIIGGDLCRSWLRCQKASPCDMGSVDELDHTFFGFSMFFVICFDEIHFFKVDDQISTCTELHFIILWNLI